jgi:hypothetical protein
MPLIRSKNNMEKTTYQALQLPIELIQKTLSILDRETAVLVEQALS